MIPKALTERGIERLIKLETNLVLQILGPIKQGGGESNFMKVSLSDGFAFLKDVVLTAEARSGIPDHENLDFLNSVIKVQATKDIGRDGKIVLVVSNFDMVSSEIQDRIGKPIPYEDFKKNGNPMSTNFIPQKKKSSNNNNRNSNSNSRSGESKPKKQSLTKVNQSKQKALKEKEKPQASKAIEPIHKRLSPQRTNGSVQYTALSDLMVDQTGWTILTRLIKKTEPRTFVGKKGPSCIMNIELIDKHSTTIEGVVFGDAATKLSQSLEINEVYEITGGNVEMTKGQGGQLTKDIQLVFNDKSVFKLFKGKEANSINYLEQLAIKISQIITKEADDDKGWSVIGIVREQRKMEMLKTKAGKDMPKKTIVVCDPDEKIEIPITLFFKLAQQQFGDQPYFFKGVFVREYQGKKQFSMSFKSSIMPFGSYKFTNKRGIEDIDFKMGVQESVPTKKSSSLMKVISDEEKVTETACGWNSVRCYINAVKTSGTLWYMGCPECKKKVLVDAAFKCGKCGKNFPKPRYYYILNIEIQDWYTSIWVVMYDEVARVLLEGLEADDAKDMDQDEFRQHTKKIKNKEVEFLLQSRGETYEGVFRVKHSVFKLIPIEYQHSAKETLKKIKEYMYL